MASLHIKTLTSPTSKGGPRYTFFGVDRRYEIYEIVIDGNEAATVAGKVKEGLFYFITNFNINKPPNAADKDAYVTLCTGHNKSHVSTILKCMYKHGNLELMASFHCTVDLQYRKFKHPHDPFRKRRKNQSQAFNYWTAVRVQSVHYVF